MTTDNRLWRVTRAGRGDGDAVELEVRGDDSEHVTTWLLSYGDGWDRVQARTAREAVATWVVLAGFAPTAAEILAPGEPSRAELAARSTAAEARVAELLSDRAEAAEVLVTEVERAQTAERRAAELTAALREAWQERDAALAAVDAVRADYAPRREPPTADEVRAVSRSLSDEQLSAIRTEAAERVVPHDACFGCLFDVDRRGEGITAYKCSECGAPYCEEHRDCDKHDYGNERCGCGGKPVPWEPWSNNVERLAMADELIAMRALVRGGDRG